ncbi:DsbA family oxidoreductase, partial [Nocardioides sp.]|uniref:DsbA family oxidoreductase n=1 Tax=Nocardioides sp. TaxID=35761 RepID=UPI002733C652
MRVEVWSDVVCPWCYIGKRRLERALAEFPHRDEVEVVWRSYQLDPGAPAEVTQSAAEYLAGKYGGGLAGAHRMMDQVEAVAAEEGLLYRLRDTQRVNTRDAHRLLHHALETGGVAVQGRLKEALLAAYFLQARNVADHDVLVELADAAGLEEKGVRAALDSNAHDAAVEADVARAAAYGAGGVPFFVVEERYGVSGAQPAETFRQLLDRAWRDSHPAHA